jgi:hypothetical protein
MWKENIGYNMLGFVGYVKDVDLYPKTIGK